MRLSFGFAVCLLTAVSAEAQTARTPDGLHIPKGSEQAFNIQTTDGGGNQWMLQKYLSVYGGRNYVYASGLVCQASGASVQSPNNRAWRSKNGDEYEIGPYTRNNLQIYRRVKIYKDRGMARWMDIIINTSSSKQVVSVNIASRLNRRITSFATSSGTNKFGKDDWAFITDHQGQASLLHIVCGEKSKIHPNVSAAGQNINVSYQVKVPARKAAILCYFEAQAANTNDIKKIMGQFNARELLRDLPSSVRNLIVNFRSSGGISGVNLDRNNTADTVVLKNGDTIYGKITNKEFEIEPFFGKLTLPAKQVIGFANAAGNDESAVYVVLAGGQIVAGKLADAVIRLDLPTGGSLEIPIARIKQCAYCINNEKPEESDDPGSVIALRTGDHLIFDPADLKCTFQTRDGLIQLSSKDLRGISLNEDDHGVHRVEFTNGSMLAGVLGPEKIVLPLKLGLTLDVSRDMIVAVSFPESEEDTTISATIRVALNNGDELLGRPIDEELKVITDFGTVSVRPENISEITFDSKTSGQATINMWDGSKLRGKIGQDTLRFALQPGPELNLNIQHIASIKRNNGALPPEETVKMVEKYIIMLSAANFKDREEAQEAMISMGRIIAPMLIKHLKDPDPEVRQRITNILDKLGVKAD